MRINKQIKQLRDKEGLTQEDFARNLGVTTSYISMLETDKNIPSEQLILSICRTYGVSYEWLKEGKGEMYDKSPRLTPKGISVVEEIHRRIDLPDRTLALSDLAYILGIDPENFPSDSPFPIDFYRSLSSLIEIFERGDADSINAVVGLFRALNPHQKRPGASDRLRPIKTLVKKKRAT